MKELAPSDQLRKWFDHETSKFQTFKDRYWNEFDDKQQKIDNILDKAQDQQVTLIYGAEDREHNNAVVLREYLAEKLE